MTCQEILNRGLSPGHGEVNHVRDCRRMISVAFVQRSALTSRGVPDADGGGKRLLSLMYPFGRSEFSSLAACGGRYTGARPQGTMLRANLGPSASAVWDAVLSPLTRLLS